MGRLGASPIGRLDLVVARVPPDTENLVRIGHRPSAVVGHRRDTREGHSFINVFLLPSLRQSLDKKNALLTVHDEQIETSLVAVAMHDQNSTCPAACLIDIIGMLALTHFVKSSSIRHLPGPALPVTGSWRRVSCVLSDR
jgi:hypothetical protein